MNRGLLTDPEPRKSWNQSPNELAADATTRSDLGRVASARVQRDHKLKTQEFHHGDLIPLPTLTAEHEGNAAKTSEVDGAAEGNLVATPTASILTNGGTSDGSQDSDPPEWQKPFRRIGQVLWKFMKFVGPGFMIAVAYIDPGNYATDAAAGASYRFRLLFVVLMSNIFAIVLQSLCIRLSTVTGLNLAEMNKKHCPPWLNYALWFFGEGAVIATDIAEVIGFAVALNLLEPKLPLVAGCAISVVDVLLILLFHRPNGSMMALRLFEGFVIMLVLGVAVCFCYQLTLIQNVTVGEVFKGYLPSSAVVSGQGIYQACGILGATVMPHSLYLGSGLNGPRLRHFDAKRTPASAMSTNKSDDADSLIETPYRPSLAAINNCMKYSIWELGLSLFTFACFINSAILIICGASLHSVAGAQNADLFGIYDLLHNQVGPAAATVFAVALLLSGTSAGIVCTMAGQMINEGQINWKLRPWMTRLLTRSISILPAILVAGLIGKKGLSAALIGSQVALSVILPFVSAPLIYYTSRNKFMTVAVPSETNTSAVRTDTAGDQANAPETAVKMRNHWVLTTIAVLIWLLIAIMNVANIVITASGVA